MTDATESDVPESIPQEEEASCEALTQLDDDTTIGGGDAPSPSPAAEPEDREAEMQPEAHQHEASPEVPAEALQETSPGVQPEGLQHREATRRKPPFCYTRPPVYQHCSGTLGTARVLPLTTLPHAMKVHPRGFRVLSGKSPLERTLGSYFRLPPPPSRQSLKEMTRVKRLLDWRGRSASEVKKPRKLDGFALLEACQVDDPDDATEGVLTDRGFNSVVQEDMEFFSKLEYLDLGENEVALHELTRLNKLEELHLPCCQLSTITLPAGSFTVLSTLNLSFNNFTDPAIVSTLASSLPRLSKLDLSGNNLQTLPPSSTLPFQCLKQLALENNRYVF
ncbi:Plant intracellular Ras-group-related LRR protein 4 [Diplonema papillatum]|nr:Plant intracellular Ras-group-related LRR protein 4 [Diplonema papillatum]